MKASIRWIPLDTDASGWAIGAVLLRVSQQQDGHERVIAYGSRLYSRAESRYNTLNQSDFTNLYTSYFQELLAVKKALNFKRKIKLNILMF